MGLEPGLLAINVSAAQFAKGDLPNKVLHMLEATGLCGTRLELELTESLIMSDPESAAVQMNQMSAAGVRFAVDDFGTGFSSLSRLNQLPIATLKIDRAFVRGLEVGPSSRPLVEAMIALSRALSVDLVAEGVETEHQRASLMALGCAYLQGYLFLHPVESSAAEKLLIQQRDLRPTLFVPEKDALSFVM